MGFRVSCFESRDSSFGFWVLGFWLPISGYGVRFRVLGFDFHVLSFGFGVGFRVSDLKFRVSSFDFQVLGFGFGVSSFE